MTKEDLAAWWSRIEMARARRKREEDLWQLLLDGYLPGSTNSDRINCNIHFRNTESKKAKLFDHLPEFQLTPGEPLKAMLDPETQQPVDRYDVIAVKRAVLNKLLGRTHAKLLDTIDDVLFDAIQTSGVAASKICYEADFAPTPQPVQTGETPVQGSVLGLQTVPQLETQTVDVPIYERWRWYRFSPKKLLIPHDWHSTSYDDAPWLGMEFNLPLRDAKRLKLVPPDAEGNTTTDDLRLERKGDQDRDSTGPRIKGVELWARAVQFRDGVYHSELFDVIVLIEGNRDRPAKYTPSPYQTIGPDGRLTADSMIGNPIHPCALRTVTDCAWIPSDAAFTNPLVKQMNTWRSQDIKLRDSNIARFFYAEGMKEQVDKLNDLDTGQGVPVPDEKLMQGADKIIAPIPHLERAQADVQGEASIRRDIDETLAIGSNQAGNVTNTVRSATEVATVQQGSDARMHKEQSRFVDSWLLTGVAKFDSLVMRYADTRDYVEIVGQDGAKRLQAWDKNLISVRCAYEAKPDSQLVVDAAQDRASALEFINYTAKSPVVDQLEAMRWLANKFGVDPRIVKAPDPPPPPPEEKPSVTWAIKIEDFYGPGAEIARQLAQQAGVTITPEALAAAQTMGALYAAQQAAQTAAPVDGQPPPPASTAHGGAADKADLLNKHAADLTGNMPGRVPAGAPPPPAQGSMVQ